MAPATVPSPGAPGTAMLISGTEVWIFGLKARPDLNGMRGVVVAYVVERERYHVTIRSDAKEEMYLRRANLTAIGGSDETKPAEPETNPEPEADFDEDAAAKAAAARDACNVAAATAEAAERRGGSAADAAASLGRSLLHI